MTRLCRTLSVALVLTIVVTAAAQEAKDGKKKYKRDWSDKNLSKRDLRPENFDDNNLENADLSFANATGVSFKNANLQGADLTSISAARADFTGADLRDAKLEGAPGVQEATFDKANLSGLDLFYTSLQRCKLKGADLRKLKRIGDITRADFTGADLRGANLQDAKDYGPNSAVFRNAKYDRLTRWHQGFDVEASRAKLVEEDEKK